MWGSRAFERPGGELGQWLTRFAAGAGITLTQCSSGEAARISLCLPDTSRWSHRDRRAR